MAFAYLLQFYSEFTALSTIVNIITSRLCPVVPHVDTYGNHCYTIKKTFHQILPPQVVWRCVMPKVKRSLLVILFMASLAALAPDTGGMSFGDWENQSPGPYTGNAVISHPQVVSVITAGNESPAPPVSYGSGNVLCIDAREQTETVTVSFTFTCLPNGGNSCRVGYHYSAFNIPTILGGFRVHIDAAGDYSSTERIVYLGKGQRQTSASLNAFQSNGCVGEHTIESRVLPGCLLCVDDIDMECKFLTPADQATWGAIKALYDVNQE
jgi:hypothetical protein